MEQGNQTAFQQTFEALSPEEQQVVEAMQYLQAQTREESGQEE